MFDFAIADGVFVLRLMLGIDIDNNTKAWQELGSNIRVEIGSQGDEHFLTELKHKQPGEEQFFSL